MSTVSRFVFACAAGLLLTGGGCARAYHDYSDCYIDCKYCAPPPLPYLHYKDCVCHSCAASRYLGKSSQPVNQENREAQPYESHDDQASSP